MSLKDNITNLRNAISSLKARSKEIYDAGFGEGYVTGFAEAFLNGKNAAYDEYWDEYQTKGSRNNYRNAFAGFGWTDKTFKPKYSLASVGEAYMMFAYSKITNIVDYAPSITTSSAQYMFLNAVVAEVGYIDCGANPYGIF